MGRIRKSYGKYSEELVSDICRLISSDSYTVREVCDLCGIHPSCFYNWMNTREEFMNKITQARKDFRELTGVVAHRSLIRRIQGYSYNEVRNDYVYKDGVETLRGKTVITKHVEPDTSAIIFALTNVDPENWKRNAAMMGDDVGGTTKFELVMSTLEGGKGSNDSTEANKEDEK